MLGSNPDISQKVINGQQKQSSGRCCFWGYFCPTSSCAAPGRTYCTSNLCFKFYTTAYAAPKRGCPSAVCCPCTEKSQHRKFETNITRKVSVRLHNLNINVPVSDLLYIFPRSICLFFCMEIYGPILVIYKSLTDTWMLKLGLRPRNSQKRNT